MSKREVKLYRCVHDACTFKTDKRKSIYTHLVRTHGERKEDYECEYCNTMFQADSDIEQHLHVQHPQQPFTYTCVSRIEKIINNCAKLGSESKRSNTPVKSTESTPVKSTDSLGDNSGEKLALKVDNPSPISKPPYLKPNISMRTRASVNESLNNIAKQPRYSVTDKLGEETQEKYDETVEGQLVSQPFNEENVEMDTDEESPTLISKPSGLKIKLSIKQPSASVSHEVISERSCSPPQSEPSMTSPEIDPDQPELADDTPPEIVRIHNTRGKAQVRVKDSKYYDKLEVYHHTDSLGRRCCPFCDYKTSKNTIRVHLSGIHKMHFVKCSLCDYKAAFPHQITQHGIKFHKTTNLNVIQLSKQYRDKIISQLSTFNHADITESSPVGLTESSNATGNDSEDAIIDDEDFESEESYPTSADENEFTEPADDRLFKPPKCQTSKTDYYSIRRENGIYLYSCNLCKFQTPVRATIYTHKYRHEEKSYRCGYCDFTSAPRSNVVHHCRVKHKNSPVNVIENDVMDELDLADDINSQSTDAAPVERTISVKSEPVESDESKISPTFGVLNVPSTSANPTPDHGQGRERCEKPQQTIIKVPQFHKRANAAVSYEETKSQPAAKKPKQEEDTPGQEYKLSLNKLYRINPTGSPKFMCALCSYACDTHPKMKHHLYRHRPQKYKCPYCDHRKYPRSYVVRHVRDTHRNKPVRVIDLSKGNEPEDIPEYMHEGTANDSVADQTVSDVSANITDNSTMEDSLIKQEPADEVTHARKHDVIESSDADDQATEQNEEVNALRNFAQTLNLRSVLTADLNDDLFTQSPDVSPNFSDAVYTSTPLIESYINGPYTGSNPSKMSNKNFEKKKSLKDYRVNYGHGPRYICNKCGYGTENYKTIHNHMYRHESQRYQCPYCGYRRSPKSFVENHIREVHKGHPVIVTELSIEQEMTDTPIGSPRQCVSLKRKDVSPDQPSTPPLTTPAKQQKTAEETDTPKQIVPSKLPAPKLAPNLTETSKQKSASPGDKDSMVVQELSPVEAGQSAATTGGSKPSSSQPINAPTLNPPFRFIERNRTTFKTMYKCVFDSETCNHISKDKSKMKQHLFMHVEYKPWSCDLCDMTASQSSHIKNHVRTEHPNVTETSFKYKKHNYLEKHIEGFLMKGLFTVPVNEYRAIMDMKGNTKSSKQPTFARDEEGNLLCPYCSYRTKSGGLTDHVKMKHMQPRFKCHWCDYRAFYRSEVRKHHRKERSHFGLEFKTQELDLVQVMEGYKEQNGIQTLNKPHASAALSLDPTQLLDDDTDDEDDGNSECSSSDGSSIGDYQHGYVEYTTEQLSDLCSNKQDKTGQSSADISPATTNTSCDLGVLNTEIGPDGSMNIVRKPKSIDSSASNDVTQIKNSKFKCGYCSFTAALRVKVKMHCSKKHAEKVVSVIEPLVNKVTIGQNNLDLHAEDWKGTRFEQDLRKAGVSKLNLASLFPNSKRFKNGKTAGKSTEEANPEITSENNDEDSSNDASVDSDTEFKKPLGPIVKHKINEKKPVPDDMKKSTGLTNKKKAAIESADKDCESRKVRHNVQKKILQDIKSVDSNVATSSVGSLFEKDYDSKTKDCKRNSEKPENISDLNGGQDAYKHNTDDISDEVTQQSSRLLTAFPNCTPVILEDESNEDKSKCPDDDVAVSSKLTGQKLSHMDTVVEESDHRVNKSNDKNILCERNGMSNMLRSDNDENRLANGHNLETDGTLLDDESKYITSKSHEKYEANSLIDRMRVKNSVKYQTTNGESCAVEGICDEI